MFLLLIYVSEYTQFCLFPARFHTLAFELKMQTTIKASLLPMQTIYVQKTFTIGRNIFYST